MIQILLFIIDAILINIALLLSFLIRYGMDIPAYNFTPYKDNFAFLMMIYMLAFSFAKCFRRRYTGYWQLFTSIFAGLSLGSLFSIVLLYIFRSQWSTFPSSIFPICFLVSLVLIFVANGIFLRLTGRMKKYVIVIGRDNIGELVSGGSLVEYRHVTNIGEILQYNDIDEIVICKHIHDHSQLNLLIYLLLKLKVNVLFSPSVYSSLVSGNMMDEHSVNSLSTFVGQKSDYEEFLLKAFDIVGSIILCFLFTPLIIIVFVLIKLTSGGPVFFTQTRVAKDGKLFTLYKFRTMEVDAENLSGPVLASKNDSRVTKIGRFLRDMRIDEIPQLFNVIIGDMSLVGPRPERPHFVKRHKVLREIRLAVKPGLTGFAQIRKLYDLHPKHKMKYDYLYIQRRSLRLNLYILISTIPVMLGRKGQ